MTRISRIWSATAAVAIAVVTISSAADGQTAPKAPPNAQRPIPPTSTPATPPAPVTATAAPVPPDGAVALCADGTFVKDPGTAADCAKHGGLKVALPPHTKTLVRKANPTPNVSSAVINQSAPAGATMRCKDGTYLTGTPAKDRCANNGGLAVILPAATPPPAAPPRRPQ